MDLTFFEVNILLLKSLQIEWDEKNFTLMLHGTKMPTQRPEIEMIEEENESMSEETKKEAPKEKDRIDKAMEKLMQKQGKMAAKRILGDKIKD